MNKFGYHYTLTFCFICYAIRLGLISLAPTPWWVLPIELFMEGPSYALSLITIVSYASVVAPPGTSVTVQGLVQGVNAGLGNISYTILYNTSMYQVLFYYKRVRIHGDPKVLTRRSRAGRMD